MEPRLSRGCAILLTFEKLMNWQSRVSEAIGAFHSTTSSKFASHVDKGKPRGNLVKMIQTGADGPVMLPVRQTRGGDMNMSGESLLVVLFVGLVAGWLAGQFVQGTGFGLIGDLVVGLLGALIGSWLLPQLGIHLGTGLISAIVNATIGAVLLLLIVRLVRGGGGWQRSWWRR
jgi:uncharacterized membrane protein YeaQ/YmgE (transglycosylase-associated protein family)